MAKVDSVASIVMYGKVPNVGWRRGSIAFAKNHVPKPGVMILSGCEVICGNPTFQIRTYENRKNVYTPVSSDYREAVALLERMQDTRKRELLDRRLGIALPKTAAELAGEKAAEEARLEAERNAKRKTLNFCSADYLARKKGLSRHSDALYRCIPAFVTFTGKTYLDEVTERDVVNWINKLKAGGFAQRTCQTRYSTLRGWLSKYGINLNELIDGAEHRRMNKKLPGSTEPYSEDELETLFAACDEYQRVVYTLLLMTGFREQEAAHLTWREVKFKANKIVLDGEKSTFHPKYKKGIHFKTKNGKGREVPLFPTLRKVLEDWREKNPDSIFVIGTDGDRPPTHLLRTLKRLAAKNGLNCGQCESCSSYGTCENIFLHRLRHSYAHTCLEKFSLHQVSKWMGHSSVAITAIYLTGTPKDATVDPFAMEAAA